MASFDGSIEIDRTASTVFDVVGTHVVFRLSTAPRGNRGTLLRFRVEVELTGTNRLLEPLASVLLRARQKTLRDIKAYVEANTA